MDSLQVGTSILLESQRNKVIRVSKNNIDIVVRGTSERPYYKIKYLDDKDKKYHIGYGSYELSNVFEWLNECFEIVDKED